MKERWTSSNFKYWSGVRLISGSFAVATDRIKDPNKVEGTMAVGIELVVTIHRKDCSFDFILDRVSLTCFGEVPTVAVM